MTAAGSITALSSGTNDVLNRVESLIDNDGGSTHLADYTYMGASTVLQIDYTEPQVHLDLWGGSSGSFTGLDRFGRDISHLWHFYGTTAADVDKFDYAYDRDSNRINKQNLGPSASALDETYAYDNLNRLTVMKRGTLSSGSISGTPTIEHDYTLDALGNWKNFTTKAAGSTDLNQGRAHNAANETGTITTTTGTAWASPAQDAAGNMTTVPKPNDPANGFTAIYDAWNRLVQLKSGSDTVAKYHYDGRGRRIIKESYTGGSLSETRHFYHSDGDQVLEERTGTSPDSAPAERQYVWGIRYIDELVLRDRDADLDGSHTLEQRLYALQDANFNLTAIVNTSGAVQERFSYTPYGVRTVLDSSFAGTSDSFDWTVGHQGLAHDGESRLVFNRARYLHPGLGRYVQRDSLARLLPFL